jgi:hypothetical protein
MVKNWAFVAAGACSKWRIIGQFINRIQMVGTKVSQAGKTPCKEAIALPHIYCGSESFLHSYALPGRFLPRLGRSLTRNGLFFIRQQRAAAKSTSELPGEADATPWR